MVRIMVTWTYKEWDGEIQIKGQRRIKIAIKSNTKINQKIHKNIEEEKIIEIEGC